MPAQIKNKRILIVAVVFVVVAILAITTFILKTDQTNKEASDVRWQTTAEGTWSALGTPPDCPNPFKIKSPTDISKVTSILYPGQVRGGDYKPHGGFRFDGLKNSEISVTSPINGYVLRGGRFLAGGEVQYTFDIINPCGYMVRVGHLLTLSPTFQSYADKFPPAVEGDSRTVELQSYARVKEGDVIATGVGLTTGNNTSFDFGVYDLRKQNEASKSTAYQQMYSNEKEQAFYALCWFDLLPTEDAAKVKSLPAADGAAGKTSDYC